MGIFNQKKANVVKSRDCLAEARESRNHTVDCCQRGALKKKFIRFSKRTLALFASFTLLFSSMSLNVFADECQAGGSHTFNNGNVQYLDSVVFLPVCDKCGDDVIDDISRFEIIYIDGNGIAYALNAHDKIATVVGCKDRDIEQVEIKESITVRNGDLDSSAFDEANELLKSELDVTLNIEDYYGEYKVVALVQAFGNCSKLKSITLHDSIKNIGSFAFSGCSSLTSINIPASVTTIGNGAFESCKSLTSINIPASVTTISHSMFKDCESLASINIPDSVTTIDHLAFYGCKTLTSINIPASVTTIGVEAFRSCQKLTSITIPSNFNLKLFGYDEDRSYWDDEENSGIICIDNYNADFTPKDNTTYKIWCYDGTHFYVDGVFKIAGSSNDVIEPTETSLGVSNGKYTLLAGSHPTYLPDGRMISGNVTSASTTVTRNGADLDIILQDPLGAITKDGDTFELKAPELADTSGLDADHAVEYVHAYDINPYVNGTKIEGKLNNKVRLLYEIPSDWDKADLQVVLMQAGDDMEFDEKIEEFNGKHYLVLWTDHFSPYAFIDTLSAADKAKTGENNTNVYVTLMTSVVAFVAACYMFIKKRKKIEE